MTNSIKITEVIIEDKKLKIRFVATGEITKYFCNNEFWAVYSSSIAEISKSIAIIPFVTQILPLIWITDTTLIGDEIDANFYHSIEEFKKGYIKMYPKIRFGGSLVFNRLVNNHMHKEKEASSAMLFSGGVDAFATLLSHIDEKPALITIQGSDIHLDENEKWDVIKKRNKETADLFGVNFFTISSNYTVFINQKELNNLVYKRSNDNWWHGFQHGIGMLGLVAPLAYSYNIIKLYIASSHTPNDNVCCASDPSIDNHLRFSNCRIFHDLYDFTRLEKIRLIGEYTQSQKKSLYLRVCLGINNEGYNCCKCEKCIRTAIALKILGYNPDNFGFYEKEIFKRSKLKVLRKLSPTAVPLWKDMQNFVLQTANISLPKKIKWIRECNFDKERKSYTIRAINLLCRKFPIMEKIINK